MRKPLESRSILVPIPEREPVSAILDIPRGAKVLLVLAHGAGAGMRHPAMEALSSSLNGLSVATFRYQFPYTERGSKRPDPPDVAVLAVVAATHAAARAAPDLPLFAGGRSFGGRMTTTAAARGLLPMVRGIVCFAFPLHPAKKPATTRAAHLADVRIPTLFIQGTRDDLADLSLVKRVVKSRQSTIKLHIVKGADHSFAVLKSSGRSTDEVLDEIATACIEFCGVQ